MDITIFSTPNHRTANKTVTIENVAFMIEITATWMKN
jgi:hypothetical protein